MFAVQIAEVLPQCDKELRHMQPTAIIHHRHGAQLLVFESRGHLCLEHSVVFALQSAPHALASLTRTPGVAALGQEISLHGVEETEVVVLNLAQFEEVDAASWSLLGVQVDHYIAQRRLEEDGHVNLISGEIRNSISP